MKITDIRWWIFRFGGFAMMVFAAIGVTIDPANRLTWITHGLLGVVMVAIAEILDEVVKK